MLTSSHFRILDIMPLKNSESQLKITGWCSILNMYDAADSSPTLNSHRYVIFVNCLTKRELKYVKHKYNKWIWALMISLELRLWIWINLQFIRVMFWRNLSFTYSGCLLNQVETAIQEDFLIGNWQSKNSAMWNSLQVCKHTQL